MPYIDIVSKGDRSSLWYFTNSLSGNAGGLDPEKETILMLPPLFLDSSWLRSQMYDPRLALHYNIVALDTRSHGKSRNTVNGARDSWVDAADVALFHQTLRLPPVHVFAVQMASANVAIRLACLFPEMCRSLTLINVPPPRELGWVAHMYEELLPMWCYPEDLIVYEHACLELSFAMLGRDCSTDLQDELIASWAMLYPPWRRSGIYEYLHTILNRTPLTREEHAAITTPTLIIQAENTPINPVKYARELAKKLVNVPGGAKVQVIKGGPEYVTIVPASASIVNRIFANFVNTVSKTPLPPPKPKLPRRERMQVALDALAYFANDPDIARRDPSSPISFSRVSPETRDEQTATLKRHQADERTAFSPLGEDGYPQRIFSDRYEEHWFGGGRDFLSSAKETIAIEREAAKPENKIIALEKRMSEADNAAERRLLRRARARSPVEAAVASTARMRRSTHDKKDKPSFAATVIQTAIPATRKLMTT